MKRSRDAQDGQKRDDSPTELVQLRRPSDEPGPERDLGESFAEASADYPDRRDFFRIAGASLALAGLSSCGRGPLRDEIVPYVHEPEDVIPGRASHYATSLPIGAGTIGVLVTTHTGRPTKIEGNELHPSSGDGATDAITQAQVLSLYDPDRSQSLLRDGRPTTWRRLGADLRGALAAHRVDGSGLRLLTGAVPSPSLAEQIREFLGQHPGSRWHVHDPLAPAHTREGIARAFGVRGDVHYRLAEARVVAAIDADLFTHDTGAVRYARDFARARRRDADMVRLYAAEPMPTTTGAMADHRLALPASAIESVLRALAAELGLDVEVGEPPPGGAGTERWIRQLARDLQENPGRGVVAVGERQPPSVHALALAINDRVQNIGRTVMITAPIDESAEAEPLEPLVADIGAGLVQSLIILESNPVATAPDDLQVAERLAEVPTSLHFGMYHDETGQRCRYHVPAAHPLEGWGDGRGFDGTVALSQPVIRPIHGGRTASELLAELSPSPEARAVSGPEGDRARLRAYWRRQGVLEPGFDAMWRRALHDGVVPGSALAPQDVTLDENAAAEPPQPGGTGLEIAFALHPRVADGRFLNNEWLQELPDPVTTLTWDNAALMSRRTADALGVDAEDEVEIRLGARAVAAPVWIVAGHADDSVTLHLGYGRPFGRIGQGIGFRAETLRSSEAAFFARGAEVSPTGRQWPLATTQDHHQMEGRDLIREASAGEYRANRTIFERPLPELSLFADWEYPEYRWAMSIDLSTCIGCGTCTIACQAENNIPIVGKEGVQRSREMHWIRVDTYETGDPAAPEIRHQPVPCMHCERAPCELVCPVQATVHSSDGLNDQIYNRCVGTRYCSHNCPYKVRRFNFFDIRRADEPQLDPQRNPEVTVRTRGVMEKCTYCVQRISLARIESRREGRRIRDGEVMTACQQACPADAIVFGDLNDPDSRIAQLRQSPRSYGILEELNTRPRTTYLAKLTNPAPDPEAE